MGLSRVTKPTGKTNYYRMSPYGRLIIIECRRMGLSRVTKPTRKTNYYRMSPYGRLIITECRRMKD